MSSGGEAGRVGLLQPALSVRAARHERANKTSHSADPLEPHHRAICNVRISGAPCSPETGQGDGENKGLKGAVTQTGGGGEITSMGGRLYSYFSKHLNNDDLLFHKSSKSLSIYSESCPQPVVQITTLLVISKGES